MSKEQLHSQLDQVANTAAKTKLGRLLKHPFRYVYAILYRAVIYPRHRKDKALSTTTFFGEKITILLPASTDIYLTGGKSHPSEIQLARFLINRLKSGDTFVDIGAHYGYFSVLAARIVGKSGNVHAFEAAPKTYQILHENSTPRPTMNTYHLAVSDKEESLTFYEFPNMYSEYNSIDIDQFKDEPWFVANQPKAIQVESVILSTFLAENNIHPSIIKIDIEGAELKAIRGLKDYLSKHHPIIIMEFLSDQRGNEVHIKAAALLHSLGYLPYAFDENAQLISIPSAQAYLRSQGIESDNITFVKSENTDHHTN